MASNDAAGVNGASANADSDDPREEGDLPVAPAIVLNESIVDEPAPVGELRLPEGRGAGNLAPNVGLVRVRSNILDEINALL